MKRPTALLFAAAFALAPASALAEGSSSAEAAAAQAGATLPRVLTDEQRRSYREIFAAIRAGDWASAAVRLDGMQAGPLHDVARARLYLAPGSPRVESGPLLDLLSRARQLPQAEQLARLASTRSASDLPNLPQAQRLVWIPGQPRRGRARGVRGEAAAATLEALVQPLIVADRPVEAEALLNERGADLSPEARTEFQQRIAWSHYLIGNDTAARDLANRARSGVGEWVIQAIWVAGLANWRLGECLPAAEAFATVAARSTDQELTAAGHYWAARADMVCRRPERVQPALRNAARLGETFYGLLAARALGLRQSTIPNSGSLARADWRSIADESNVRWAAALVEIGETELADDHLRHQARIGNPRQHEALIQLASRLDLTGTQMWLAHNAPRGVTVDPLARYPMPDWRPRRGWRVDRALVFAHALQESNFRPDAVSPAGARGLMQVRPGTAGDILRWRGESSGGLQLTDPATNLELGQSYLEYLRDLPGTGGLLPRVIAAYNAGPGPIPIWTARSFDRGDPLLYIESIPYWETRGYVPIILRNYWIYEQRAGQDSASRAALVQGMWPRFPGLAGGPVRMNQPSR
ncbi:lytic transglycosylase domain-containing protein [Allosphingosinicella sp.]|jgi:soluble lytic murein transglycosylase-like protein|uniref:lytic transglycosylase domain-containing protein n=1 Tax=Allosphingosinicella sp. TaxID=2823234 RepID=UPI002EF0DFE3